MYNFKLVTNTIDMKPIKNYLLFIIFILCTAMLIFPNLHTEGLVFAESLLGETSIDENLTNKQKPMLAIVIDDFGSFDRSGVKTMLAIESPLTCAIMPNLENSAEDIENAKRSGKEIILHMPMQSHVNLPADWYGPIYIYNNDTPADAIAKLEKCLSTMPEAKGFNIHIGSGVSQNSTLMKAIMGYAKEHNLVFLDSRTHIGTVCDDVAKTEKIIYIGRDEFLEPDHNKSYANVKQHLLVGRDLALEKGYAVVIGHVGSHGGENTANAIKDSIKEIEDSGVELVFLSDIYKRLSSMHTNS